MPHSHLHKEDLNTLLKLQDVDMKMIRLMSLKRERKKESEHLFALKSDLERQIDEKSEEIRELDQMVSSYREKVQEVKMRIQEIEEKQKNIKQLTEFNALAYEISVAQRELFQLEQLISKLIEEKTEHEEIFTHIQGNLKEARKSSGEAGDEIQKSILAINQEGRTLQQEREQVVKELPEELFLIYEKLLKKKRDRVIVPINEEACGGCNILLTPHYENLVKRGGDLIFCEHCSRVLYWNEERNCQGELGTLKKKRRRKLPLSSAE